MYPMTMIERLAHTLTAPGPVEFRFTGPSSTVEVLTPVGPEGQGYRKIFDRPFSNSEEGSKADRRRGQEWAKTPTTVVEGWLHTLSAPPRS